MKVRELIEQLKAPSGCSEMTTEELMDCEVEFNTLLGGNITVLNTMGVLHIFGKDETAYEDEDRRRCYETIIIYLNC